MTKTSQQIAEELARKCAEKLMATVCRKADGSDTNLILQSIPLVELLECYDQLEVASAYNPKIPCDCATCKLLANLNTKLKQLGIIV